MPAPEGGFAVRPVSIDDLVAVLAAGARDLRAAPTFGMGLAALFVAAGWLLIALLFRFGLPYLVYPLAMGFALVAPFAAVGFYAVSDMLARGEAPTWRRLGARISAAARRDVRWMALVTGFALFLWMDIAAMLFFGFFGLAALGPDFLERLLMTPAGLTFLLIGHAAGAVIAMLVFSISVVSFPMLYDRDVDFVTAMVTSVRLVVANPVTMAAWCALIAVMIGLSLLSALIGLLVVLPLVGHASWHLYVRAVAPAGEHPRPASDVAAGGQGRLTGSP
jgi:uncharacterized membrane protein